MEGGERVTFTEPKEPDATTINDYLEQCRLFLQEGKTSTSSIANPSGSFRPRSTVLSRPRTEPRSTSLQIAVQDSGDQGLTPEEIKNLQTISDTFSFERKTNLIKTYGENNIEFFRTTELLKVLFKSELAKVRPPLSEAKKTALEQQLNTFIREQAKKLDAKSLDVSTIRTEMKSLLKTREENRPTPDKPVVKPTSPTAKPIARTSTETPLSVFRDSVKTIVSEFLQREDLTGLQRLEASSFGVKIMQEARSRDATADFSDLTNTLQKQLNLLLPRPVEEQIKQDDLDTVLKLNKIIDTAFNEEDFPNKESIPKEIGDLLKKFKILRTKIVEKIIDGETPKTQEMQDLENSQKAIMTALEGDLESLKERKALRKSEEEKMKIESKEILDTLQTALDDKMEKLPLTDDEKTALKEKLTILFYTKLRSRMIDLANNHQSFVNRTLVLNEIVMEAQRSLDY